MEEENWRAKWIKLFPGLVFHFEVGAEQGSAGRAMMNRVLKMGAVSARGLIEDTSRLTSFCRKSTNSSRPRLLT
jgi:regulatory subunit for Cdc7p protein kinase